MRGAGRPVVVAGGGGGVWGAWSGPPMSLIELVGPDEEDVPVVSVLDGHPHALAFIGSALGVTQIPLGVADFGQSGSRDDLYRHYGIDAASIARAARTLLAV